MYRAPNSAPSANQGPHASLRKLTIAVLLAAFVALTIAQLTAGRLLYADGFEEAERRDLLARARHAQAVIKQSADVLAATAQDYGVWDQTNDFVTGKYPRYADVNWYRQAFDRLQIDAALIQSATGAVLAARHAVGVDQVAPLDAVKLVAIRRPELIQHWLRSDTPSNGFTVIDGVPHMWGAAPIRLGESRAAPLGQIVFFRALDAKYLSSFNAALDANIEVVVSDDQRHLHRVAAFPVRASDLHFDPLTNDRLAAGMVLDLVPGGQRIELSVVTQRGLQATVRKASGFFLLSSLVVSLVVTLLALAFFERRVLGPLAALAGRLAAIGRSGSLTERVVEPQQRDEISAVAGSVNHMLAALESKQTAESARDAAIRANRLKSEFLATISHEIRTPMNGVLGMLELMAQSPLADDQRERLSTARSSAQSLLALLNSVLDLSRLEAGRMSLDPVPTDLQQLARSTVELFRAQTSDKGIALELVADDPSPIGHRVDAGKLRQVLVNLLGNAIKFTNQGGVQLEIHRRSLDAAHERVALVVTDTGIGIDPSAHEAIFDAFTQENAATTRHFGGSGLGLTISRRLIELMGGHIAVASTPGRGSTFTVTLELPTCSLPQPTSDASKSVVAGGPSLDVLVAEDNDVNQLVVSAMLDKLGCRCYLVANGADAVTMFASEPGKFDVILMDVNMPVLDGFAATAEIRRVEVQPSTSRRVPIVALTANAMAGDRERCLAAGMDAHLAKPFGLEALAAVLREVTELRSPQVENRSSHQPDGSWARAIPNINT